MQQNPRAAGFAVALVVALLIGALSGCATIIQGGSQPIPISSTPSGATVEVYNMDGTLAWSSTTPATAILKKGTGYFSGANYRVVISKSGYRAQELVLSSHLSLWYLAGNLVAGTTFIGWLVVDPLTGAMWRLEPRSVDARLNARDAHSEEGPVITVMLLEEVPSELTSELIRLN